MAVSVIKGSSAWKYVSATGGNSLTIPSDANEAIIDIANSNRVVAYSIPLSKQQLRQTSTYNIGYGYNQRNNAVGIHVANHVVNCTIFMNDGTDMLPTATITACYR